jgi:opacity protein-like surface antigen
MKGALYVAALGASLAGTMPASAQDLESGAYVGVRAIGSIAEIDDVEGNGFTGTPRVVNDSDEVAGIAGVVGYRWDVLPLRTEIEGGHRFRFDLDVKDETPGGDIDYESNVATTSVVLNAILEWRNSSAFTPFVGGTVGWARNDADTTRTVLASGAESSRDQDEDNLAWGGMVGVDWEFTENWSSELAYRYINLGEVSSGALEGGDSISTGDYTSHDILLSVFYRF